jgi:cysteinyl-tRNA synthetase
MNSAEMPPRSRPFDARPITLTNTQSHQREVFQPIEPGKVRFYSCGPTVYAPIHIGNLRAALTADLIYRFFKHMGYEVNYVRNYTDIDDKIIKRAIDENTTLEAITKKYIDYVEQDYAYALMEQPTHKTKVTDHLPEIISMIESIIQNGHAYVTPDQEVLFSIPSFPNYGKLSGKSFQVDELSEIESSALSRVDPNPNKKYPFDFSLWKPAKKDEKSWPSPWGQGRPGWHIECSAMAKKWLGPQMDIHHGGEDLVFPHHENEIAQSECSYERSSTKSSGAPYVRYWMHNAFLTLSSEKMSKSVGNIVSARDFLQIYGGEIARYIFLSVHYRTTFDFNGQTVDQAIQGLERIYEAKQKAELLRNKKIAHPDPIAEPAWGSFVIDCDRVKNKIRDHYANDLNTAGALSELYNLIREFNRTCSLLNSENTVSAILGAQLFIQLLEEEIGSVLGFGRASSQQMMNHLNTVKVHRQELNAKQSGKKVITDAEVEQLLGDRKDARAAKNFKRSDEVRDQLLAEGIEIKDSPQGTTWKRI